LSFSSADFVVVDAPNTLLEPKGPVVGSLKSFIPPDAGVNENGAGGGGDEAVSLSFSS
jgi:hypothetical protein